MAGSTGERPLGDIVTDPQFWLLHVVNFPAIFISGWLFVATGLAYDAFGTPRPGEYYNVTGPDKLPLVEDRFNAKEQFDEYFAKQDAKTAPSLE
ncbi:MAG: cytochrome b559 subunit alpha [Cyanobacteria bacterium P01_C01_bin.89]